jgi:hypothetical protein
VSQEDKFHIRKVQGEEQDVKEQLGLVTHIKQRLPPNTDDTVVETYRESLLSGDPSIIADATKKGIITCSSTSIEDGIMIRVYPLTTETQIQARDYISQCFDEIKAIEANEGGLPPERRYEITRNLSELSSATSTWVGRLDPDLQFYAEFLEALEDELGQIAPGMSGNERALNVKKDVLARFSRPAEEEGEDDWDLAGIFEALRGRVDNQIFPDQVQ